MAAVQAGMSIFILYSICAIYYTLSAWHSETALVRGAGGFAAEQMLPRAQNTAAGQRAYARCPAVSL